MGKTEKPWWDESRGRPTGVTGPLRLDGSLTDRREQRGS